MAKTPNYNLDNDENKTIILKKLLKSLQKNISDISAVLNTQKNDLDSNLYQHIERARQIGKNIQEGDHKIIEGVFTGQEMIGPDGKHYSVPVNYASKSKLVEGDILKLTIEADGTFVYKQISPQKRVRLRGTLIKDEETGDYYVLVEGKLYQILTASVTYFKAKTGDEVIVVLPESKISQWAALENILERVGDIPAVVLDEKLKQLQEEGNLDSVPENLIKSDQLETLKDGQSIFSDLMQDW
jgi:hypothetical protein